MERYLIAGILLCLAARQDTREGMVFDRWWMLISLVAVIGTGMGYQTSIGLLYGFFGVGIPMLIYSIIDDGMGGGDVKLCASIGAVIGILGGYFVIVIAMALFITAMLIRQRKHGPFVPSLFFSYLIYIVIRSAIYDF